MHMCAGDPGTAAAVPAGEPNGELTMFAVFRIPRRRLRAAVMPSNNSLAAMSYVIRI
jgi:hypothetical protein